MPAKDPAKAKRHQTTRVNPRKLLRMAARKAVAPAKQAAPKRKAEKERPTKAVRQSPPKRTKYLRAAQIYERLEAAYPDAKCALDHQNPLQLLIATILSAQ